MLGVLFTAVVLCIGLHWLQRGAPSGPAAADPAPAPPVSSVPPQSEPEPQPVVETVDFSATGDGRRPRRGGRRLQLRLLL